MAYNTLAQSATPIAPAVQPAVNLAASYTASPTAGLAHTWPIYNDPYK